MKKETLLGCLVLLVAGGILGGVGFLATRQGADDADVARMRRVYVALANYEMNFDGLPAPSLAHASGFITDPLDSVSDRDPYAKAASLFPNDAGLPKGPRTSPSRISFSYYWAFPESQKRRSAQRDPLMGLLANEWSGKVEPTSDFAANVSGPVLRITLDGSLYKISDRGGPKPLGGFEDLFLRR